MATRTWPCHPPPARWDRVSRYFIVPPRWRRGRAACGSQRSENRLRRLPIQLEDDCDPAESASTRSYLDEPGTARGDVLLAQQLDKLAISRKRHATTGRRDPIDLVGRHWEDRTVATADVIGRVGRDADVGLARVVGPGLEKELSRLVRAIRGFRAVFAEFDTRREVREAVGFASSEDVDVLSTGEWIERSSLDGEEARLEPRIRPMDGVLRVFRAAGQDQDG